MHVVGGNQYEVIKEYRNAWNYEAFRDRYNEVLERYDFIVGDWGYNQLRLKGFFKENNPKATKESSIASLHDYLQEYCNFGCAYFIVERQADRGGRSIGKPVEEYNQDTEKELDQVQDGNEDLAKNPASPQPQNGRFWRGKRR